MENEVQKKRILSGIQPSGDLTLGSYLGAIKNWAALADEYDCYYMLADMHTITVRQVPAELRRHTLTQVAAYIASGLDPEKNVLFVQSHVPAHAQLGWVLDCYTMFGELSRMTQFKDKSAKNADNINAGLFTYPALMAADILLYQADLVPVGGDQKQHVEICRDIATRFNGIYGDTFKLPDPYIPQVGARVMSLTSPEKKMSKSDKDPNGCVYMLEKPEDILRKFKKAVTDSEACVRFDPADKPGVSNLMQIYAVATGKSFETIEQGRQLPQALKWVSPAGTVLFDSITACLACQMFSGPEPDGEASPRTAEELLVISRHPAHFVCVCDELWRDGVTYEMWTETYRRGLAEICRRLAAEFDVVCELTAGLPRLWKGAWRFE